jgi:uncharacterized membrane protein
MSVRTHELHPMLIHAPLVLLPLSAASEVAAAGSRSWVRRRVLDRVGRRLWWGTAASGLLAGVAGMAASREVDLGDRRAQDAMFVHGLGNLVVVVGALGLAAWRSGHRASGLTAGFGTGALLAALYTAWLGGELVYTHGAGVKAVRGVGDAPPLFSIQAPARLTRDAAGGLGWLMRRAGRALSGLEPLHARDLTPARDAASEAPRHVGAPAPQPIG